MQGDAKLHHPPGMGCSETPPGIGLTQEVNYRAPTISVGCNVVRLTIMVLVLDTFLSDICQEWGVK